MNAHGDFLTSNPLLVRAPVHAFGTHGHDIPSRIVDDYSDSIGQPGSSFATAIAVAMAAVMLAHIETLPLIRIDSVDHKGVKKE